MVALQPMKGRRLALRVSRNQAPGIRPQLQTTVPVGIRVHMSVPLKAYPASSTSPAYDLQWAAPGVARVHHTHSSDLKGPGLLFKARSSSMQLGINLGFCKQVVDKPLS